MSKASEPAGSPGKSGKLNFAQRIVSHIDAFPAPQCLTGRCYCRPRSKLGAREGLKMLHVGG